MLRPDLEIISRWIKPGAKVLDLGCGDGVLLQHLTEQRQVKGIGLEINDENIVRCIQRGVAVIQTNLDQGLSGYFSAGMFDYVVLTQTLQAIHRPDKLLQEMLAVGNEGIITFPNMAYWLNRLQMLIYGRMPVTRTLPQTWYDTSNIHLCTIKDFEDLCVENGILILKRQTVDSSRRGKAGMGCLPNWFGEIAIYRVTRSQQ